MNRCPITYELIADGRYSQKGLRWLSERLHDLADFPFSAQEQLELAMKLAAKLSIQGVQPKLSVKLNSAKQVFEVVETGGTFIVKPPHQIYPEVPENEDVTMRLAAHFGIEIPLHGLMYNKDGTKSYFIKRFDRIAKGHKVAVEDFAQLSSSTRSTKYSSSMEKVTSVIEKHCTFPLIEKQKLFRLTLFCFLVGNEDMHLKNFSLIRREKKVELSPAYDLLNTTILTQSGEELALPLHGKKSRLTKEDFFTYFAKERLGLSEKTIHEVYTLLQTLQAIWEKELDNSFISEATRQKYKMLVRDRFSRIC